MARAGQYVDMGDSFVTHREVVDCMFDLGTEGQHVTYEEAAEIVAYGWDWDVQRGLCIQEEMGIGQHPAKWVAVDWGIYEVFRCPRAS